MAYQWVKNRLLGTSSEMKPSPDHDNRQDMIASCFTGDLISTNPSSFTCNARQCMDITDYLKETVMPFREHALDEGRIRGVVDQHAIMEFCRAIAEAKLFLHNCCAPLAAAAAASFWENSLTCTLDTGEAYELLLRNLIWSQAGLAVAILYAARAGAAAPHNNTNIEHEIRNRVAQCKRVLSGYTTAAIQPRLNFDRADLYRYIVENLPADDSQLKKRLAFAVGKSTNYQLLLQSGEATACCAQLFESSKIDASDMGVHQHFLGQGAYGYVCRRSWLGQAVAVKVFKGELGRLFKKEAPLLARLRNPFIVRMVGWFTESDGTCMMVMELAPTDLQKAIPQNIKSPLAAVDIMLQISRGMAYLHKNKIIHRDIKPSNVLLEPSSVPELAAEGYARVKLCDFGFAKVKSQSEKDQSNYSTFKLGTSYYRAPEILFEHEDADKRKYNRKVDVFSFAITCSEILARKTGPPCYKDLSARNVRAKMLENVRPDLPTDCPSHLADLIRRCWDTDHSRRPSFTRVSNILTYIKFILMRASGVRLYASVVSQFDEEELKRRASEDEEFAEAGSRRSSLQSGECLKTNQWITANGYKFVMQEGGIVVLYSPARDALWATYTEYREGECSCALEKDGNLVMYDSKDHVLWSSNSGQSTEAAYKLELEEAGRAVIVGPKGKIWATDESVERPSMRSGQFLVPHQWMLCKGYRLLMQRDSNLVLRSPSGQVLWASGTVLHPGPDGPRHYNICLLKDDGNLMICDSTWRVAATPLVRSSIENHAVWSSNSSNTLPGAQHKLELDSGRAVIRDWSGLIIWATDGKVDSLKLEDLLDTSLEDLKKTWPSCWKRQCERMYEKYRQMYEKYREYATDAEREDLALKLQEMEDWLYEEGEDGTKGVYVAKLVELKKLGDLMEERFKEEEVRGPCVEQFIYCIFSFRKAAISGDPKFDHIDWAEKEKVVMECNIAEDWLRDKKAQQDHLPRSANPVLLYAEVKKKMEALDRFCKPIMMKARPALLSQRPLVSPPPSKGASSKESDWTANGTVAGNGDSQATEPMDADITNPRERKWKHNKLLSCLYYTGNV